MNPTNYTNTLQHCIQQLSYHFQHTHACTQLITQTHYNTVFNSFHITSNTHTCMHTSNYTNTLQHCIQQLSYHFQHTHACTQAHTYACMHTHTCTHTHITPPPQTPIPAHTFYHADKFISLSAMKAGLLIQFSQQSPLLSDDFRYLSGTFTSGMKTLSPTLTTRLHAASCSNSSWCAPRMPSGSPREPVHLPTCCTR